MDWCVSLLDEDGNAVFPGDLPGLRDDGLWSLRVQVPGDETDEWGMATVADGLTVGEAYELARSMGLTGSPIGG